jgi:hypothetical protein
LLRIIKYTINISNNLKIPAIKIYFILSPYFEILFFLCIFINVGHLTVKGWLSPRGYNQHEVESMGLTGGSKFK